LLLSTGWVVQGSNPVEGARFYATGPDWPWGPPSLLYNGYWVLPGGKVAGVWS
jgi:acyl-homoserine lactone acylase PvdQ